MTENFAYPASVVRDDAGFYLVTFPDLPEAATDGSSRDDALHEAAMPWRRPLPVVSTGVIPFPIRVRVKPGMHWYPYRRRWL